LQEGAGCKYLRRVDVPVRRENRLDGIDVHTKAVAPVHANEDVADHDPRGYIAPFAFAFAFAEGWVAQPIRVKRPGGGMAHEQASPASGWAPSSANT